MRESCLTNRERRLYFLHAMKSCAHCQKEIPENDRIGRQAQCPLCGQDLRVCLNCVFYEPGVFNDCRENQAERVLDKSRSNFCDYFQYRRGAQAPDRRPADVQEKLDALFRK
ncbi:MAG: hypothetical protein GX874_08390 [Smithella sp.]|nr:hypothetical protein [Smithella sp.]